MKVLFISKSYVLIQPDFREFLDDLFGYTALDSPEWAESRGFLETHDILEVVQRFEERFHPVYQTQTEYGWELKVLDQQGEAVTIAFVQPVETELVQVLIDIDVDEVDVDAAAEMESGKLEIGADYIEGVTNEDIDLLEDTINRYLTTGYDCRTVRTATYGLWKKVLAPADDLAAKLMVIFPVFVMEEKQYGVLLTASARTQVYVTDTIDGWTSVFINSPIDIDEAFNAGRLNLKHF